MSSQFANGKIGKHTYSAGRAELCNVSLIIDRPNKCHSSDIYLVYFQEAAPFFVHAIKEFELKWFDLYFSFLKIHFMWESKKRKTTKNKNKTGDLTVDN